MKKILICDDDADIREVLEMIITTNHNVEVHHAENGKEGISLLGQSTLYDLIISDMNMPNGTGLDLYNHNKKTTRVPFILLSGNIESDIQKFEDFAGSQSVNKPWSDDELSKAVKVVLGEAG